MLIAALLSLIFAASVSYYWPFEDTYYPFNVGWNGCSELFQAAPDASILYSYSGQVSSDGSLLAIIGPSIIFDQGDAGKIRSFLNSGGIVLLADDFGTGNTLLENLNVTARFSGQPISDLYFYSKPAGLSAYFQLCARSCNKELDCAPHESRILS